MGSHNLQEQQTDLQTSKSAVTPPKTHWMQTAAKNFSLMATGGAVCVALFLGAGVWQTGSQFIANLSSLFGGKQPEPKVNLRSIVVQRIRGASELTTAVFAMEAVVPTSSERTVGGYVIGRTTLLYIAYGEVRAGVDLNEVDAEDVQVQGNTLVLKLPPPKIIDSKIDVNRSNVYNYDRGFMGLGPDTAPELQQLAQQKTLERIVEAACAQGVLEAANERAKLVVSQLMTATSSTEITIDTQTSAPTACEVPVAPPVTPPAIPPQ